MRNFAICKRNNWPGNTYTRFFGSAVSASVATAILFNKSADISKTSSTINSGGEEATGADKVCINKQWMFADGNPTTVSADQPFLKHVPV